MRYICIYIYIYISLCVCVFVLTVDFVHLPVTRMVVESPAKLPIKQGRWAQDRPRTNKFEPPRLDVKQISQVDQSCN